MEWIHKKIADITQEKKQRNNYKIIEVHIHNKMFQLTEQCLLFMITGFYVNLLRLYLFGKLLEIQQQDKEKQIHRDPTRHRSDNIGRKWSEYLPLEKKKGEIPQLK